MFYKITNALGGEQNVFMKALNNQCASVRDGEFIDDLDEADIEELPFRFEMAVRRDERDGSRQEPRLSWYYDGRQLMHKQLVRALQDAGVDNLQVFAAILTEEGFDTVNEDYIVVNLVGLVACANVEKSSAMPFADGLFISELVIDAARTSGLLMFRLADSMMDVLIHESVAEKLIPMNIPYVTITPLVEAGEGG